MQINNIALGEDGMPTGVTATLTIKELSFIAAVAGNLSPLFFSEVGDSYADYNGLYEGPVGSVFNTFWDDGVRDFMSRGLYDKIHNMFKLLRVAG